MKEINTLKTIKGNVYLIVLSCFLIVFYALFFPVLESPDEIVHLSRILNETTLWGEIVHYIGSNFFDLNSLSFIYEAVSKDSYLYARNNFIYFPVDAPAEYYFLKLINVFFVLAFFFLIVKIFNGNKLVLLWPSATYYMSLLTAEAMAYSLMLGSTTNTKSKVFLALCLGAILLLLDRSILIFCTFLLLKFFIMTISDGKLNLIKKYSFYLLLVSFIVYSISIFDSTLISGFIGSNTIRSAIITSHQIQPNYLSQAIVFLATGMMLSGSVSFYPTIFYYIYMSILLFKSFKYKGIHFDDDGHMCSILVGLSTFLIYSTFYPQLSHFRYYLFLVPPIVAFFAFRYSAKRLFLLSLLLSL